MEMFEIFRVFLCLCLYTHREQTAERLTDCIQNIFIGTIKRPLKNLFLSEGHLVDNQGPNGGHPCQKKAMLFVFLSSQMFTLLNTCTMTLGKIASKALARSLYNTIINIPQS